MAKSILIVEDHFDSAEALAMMFAYFGFITRIASDGAMALKELAVFQPDVILSDYMMPNLDGLGLWDAIQTDPSLGSIPFILMSAIADRPAFATIPINRRIKKPVAIEELLAVVNAALDQSDR